MTTERTAVLLARTWHPIEADFLDHTHPGQACMVWGIDWALRPETPGERLLVLYWDGRTVHRLATSRPWTAWTTWRRWLRHYRALPPAGTRRGPAPR